MRVSILFLFFISFCRRFFTCFVFTVCSFIPLCLLCVSSLFIAWVVIFVSLFALPHATHHRDSRNTHSHRWTICKHSLMHIHETEIFTVWHTITHHILVNIYPISFCNSFFSQPSLCCLAMFAALRFSVSVSIHSRLRPSGRRIYWQRVNWLVLLLAENLYFTSHTTHTHTSYTITLGGGCVAMGRRKTISHCLLTSSNDWMTNEFLIHK